MKATDQLRDYGSVMISKLARVRDGEKVCILIERGVDTELSDSIFNAGEKVGAQICLLVANSQDLQSSALINAAKKYSVIIMLTRKLGPLPRVMKDALLSGGARMLEFPYATVKLATNCIPIDYEKVSEEAKVLTGLLVGGREIHISSPGGSDLVFSTHGKPVARPLGYPILNGGGDFMELPNGSVMGLPVEDFGEGSLVIDGATWRFGPVEEPFTLKVRRGRVVEVVGSGREATWLRDVLEPPFAYVNHLAEFVLGLNPNARLARYMPESEKVRGGVAMDIGASPGSDDTFIGRHTDIGSVRRATVTVDGQEIIDKGRLQV